MYNYVNFQLEFMKNVNCDVVCKRSYQGGNKDSEKKLEFLRKGMAFKYQHHWIVGNILVIKQVESGKPLLLFISPC